MPAMDWIPDLVLATLLATLAGGTWLFWRRARRARHELAVDLHDKALALDRRCDVLQDQIAAVQEAQRIAHLFDLVAWGEAEGRFDAELAHRLRRYALQLRGESHAREKGV